MRLQSFTIQADFAFFHVAGPGKHQMFEQVGESGSTGLLSRRPDVIPDVHRDDGRAVILVEDDVQPVGQRELRVGELQRRGRLRHHRCRQQESETGGNRELHQPIL